MSCETINNLIVSPDDLVRKLPAVLISHLPAQAMPAWEEKKRLSIAWDE
jgi:hypothetical protein